MERISQIGTLEDDLPATSFAENVASFRINYDITKLPNLNEYDIDEQLPSTIDSGYFTVSKLAAIKTNSRDLVLLHTNIRSLSLHHDELVSLITSLNKNIDIIAVSEIWHSKKFPMVANINIGGYIFFKSYS